MNKRLSVALISILFAFGLLFLLLWMFGDKELIRCDYMINPDRDYLKNEWNFSDWEVGRFFELYSKPFVANLTFDSYQEALALKQLWIDGYPHKKWYKPTFNCDKDKLKIPLKSKEALQKALKND